MAGEKRTWQKPELIILVRSRPEEMVLVACKGPGVGVVSPNSPNCKGKGGNPRIPCDTVSRS